MKSAFPIFCILFVFLACSSLKKKQEEVAKTSTALVELGHALFFDTRLSANNTKACASCHAPQFAFTDGYRKSTGIYADETQRNAPTLLNTRHLSSLTWANSLITSYEQQMQKPFFSQDPPEMGVHPMDIAVLQRFQQDAFYQQLFKTIFPQKKIETLDFEVIITAIAAYERQLVSYGSRYDLFLKDSLSAPLNAMERKGKHLFSATLHCETCHKIEIAKEKIIQIVDYQVSNSFSDNDLGLYEATRKEEDKGKFRVPTLRNCALTDPYWHDGSIEKLEVAMLHTQYNISSEEKKALFAFLNTLTDSTIFTNPLFLPPKR
jgi:cytochrome c peroxidase